MLPGLQCNKRRTKSLVLGLVIVLAFYIPFNIMYMFSLNIFRSGAVEKQKQQLYVDIKDLIPKSDGTVDLVLSMNLVQLQRLLDGKDGVQKEATSNPLPANFTITHTNENLCSDEKNLQYIIYVHSAPKNKERRNWIRGTWGNKKLFTDGRTKVVFMMGTPAKADMMEAVTAEMEEYKDIAVGSFRDEYKNLTLKGIMGLKWVSTYCKNAKYAIKADDDAFVNLFELMKVVDKQKSYSTQIVCPLWKAHSMPILRDPAKCMKWCVKYNEFPGQTHFPQYCAGLAFLLSTDMIEDMHRKALATPFFWIDDVYITGILPPKLEHTVRYVDLLSNFTLKENLALEQYADLKKHPSYIFAHVKSFESITKLWEGALKRLTSQQISLLNEEIIKKHDFLTTKKSTR